MNNDLVKLKVVGITSNQIENGMYALVLEDVDGSKRIPIVIGYNEAQSIECMLQKITTPRPLMHDFTADILNTFNISIVKAIIKKLENGTFTADVYFEKDGDIHILDARSSDAIALAMRVNAPVYTSRELLDECGIDRDTFAPRYLHGASRQSIPARQAINRVMNPKESQFKRESEADLLLLLDKAVKNEDYEKAGEIKMELDRRHGKMENPSA